MRFQHDDESTSGRTNHRAQVRTGTEGGIDNTDPKMAKQDFLSVGVINVEEKCTVIPEEKPQDLGC